MEVTEGFFKILIFYPFFGHFSPPQPKLDVQKLQTDAKESFQLKLSNRFQTPGEITDPDDIFEEITDGIIDTAKDVLPVYNKSKPNWLTIQTKQAIASKISVARKKMINK